MAIANEQDFLDSYVHLMTNAWTNKAAAASLEADPTAFAKAAGLPVPEGASVVLDRTPSEGLLSQEVLIGDWEADPTAPVLHVPASAIIDAADLSEDELEQVSGGVTIVIACFVAA